MPCPAGRIDTPRASTASLRRTSPGSPSQVNRNRYRRTSYAVCVWAYRIAAASISARGIPANESSPATISRALTRSMRPSDSPSHTNGRPTNEIASPNT